MNDADRRELISLIDAFLGSSGSKKAIASEIEGLVLECFVDEPWYDSTIESLSLFVPGGSSPYVNEDELAKELRPVRAALTASPLG